MKILISFGTRPEIIKLAPVILTLKNEFDVITLHTQQHDILAEEMINFFNLKIDYRLKNIFSITEDKKFPEPVRGEFIEVIKKEKPDAVIVQGDTRTTFISAFASFMEKKVLMHLEAGLRTYNKFAPFPEEVYRSLISRIADIHFAPTEKAKQNLLKENIRKDRIFVVGNSIVDALFMAISKINEKSVFGELSKYKRNIEEIKKKEIVLITSHRRENIGKPLLNICESIKKLAEKYPNINFIWSLHKNPKVRKTVLNEMKKKKENIILTGHLSYPTTIYLIKNSSIILTDSGGIQEESISLGKKVIILREATERPEVIETGYGYIAGSSIKKIISIFSSIYVKKEKKRPKKNPFGDGRTSEKILKFLKRKKIEEFIKSYSERWDMNLKGR